MGQKGISSPPLTHDPENLFSPHYTLLKNCPAENNSLKVLSSELAK